MPSLEKVANYWAREWQETFPDSRFGVIGTGEPFCLACGWLVPGTAVRDKRWKYSTHWLDRAHLQDHVEEGDDSCRNIVPLCHLCHDAMPPFRDREGAVSWVNNHIRCSSTWQLWTDGLLGRRAPIRSTTMVKESKLYGEWKQIAYQTAIEGYVPQQNLSVSKTIETQATRGLMHLIIGLSKLEDGAHRNMDAQQIHEIALTEV